MGERDMNMSGQAELLFQKTSAAQSLPGQGHMTTDLEGNSGSTPMQQEMMAKLPHCQH